MLTVSRMGRRGLLSMRNRRKKQQQERRAMEEHAQLHLPLALALLCQFACVSALA